MRLVDADKLPWVDRVILVDQVDGDINITIAKEHTSYVDENAPTVDAIPIEWIKNYRDFMRNKEKGEWLGQFELNVAYGLDIMLGIWEKENE